MKSIIKTAGSFDKVLASCKSIGERYQPKTPTLSITAMSDLSDRSQQTMLAVIATRAAYRLAVNARRESFAGIPKLSVRVVRMLASFGASQENLNAANSLKEQLQLAARKKKASLETLPVEGSVPARRSAHRKHYQMRLQTFSDLVKIVGGMGYYYPNESDLQLAALKAKLEDLESKSRAVDAAAIAFDMARETRKQVIFGSNGVDDTIKGVRNYILAAFGTVSPESNQIARTSQPNPTIMKRGEN